MSPRFGNVAQAVVRSQQRLAARFDELLPASFRIDGNQDFATTFVPGFVRSGLTVYDVGGGKSPYFSAKEKATLNLYLVGFDISAAELAAAPADVYDKVICADICGYEGAADADLVICQTLLEHVEDVERALHSISSILRKGGFALLFAPSRRAVFARLNRMLPERLKRRLLYGLFPDTRGKQGFPAYYDRCTVAEITEMSSAFGLRVNSQRSYFSSSYFSFLLPAHVVWRLWTVVQRAVRGDDAAETFAVALQKL